MNVTNLTTRVAFGAAVELSEGELRALDALACYGADAFLKAFYVKLGTTYMKPFERDLRGLFDKIRTEVSPALRAVEQARATLASTRLPIKFTSVLGPAAK